MLGCNVDRATMGAACSRIRDRRKKRELYTNGPHPPWPAPSNGLKPTVDPSLQRPSEALEKGKHEAPPLSALAHKIPAAGIPLSSEAKDPGLDGVGSGEEASSEDKDERNKDERNKDEKRRLSRILSGRASTVRNITSVVAKKSASRVRASLCLDCFFLCSILLSDPVNW